jgi:hypothetical protein
MKQSRETPCRSTCRPSADAVAFTAAASAHADHHVALA